MLQPLLNATDADWVTMVGRYILNMGSVEMTTRLLISQIEGNDRSPVMVADLPSRLGYVRRRFPRENQHRHSWAMNVFDVVNKHVAFRNAVAHSPIVITGHEDRTKTVHGIFNLTPNDEHKTGELISLDELKGRVDESAAIGQALLQMQTDFAASPPTDSTRR